MTADFFGRNFAHNLEFFSDEQLSFTPAPTALCALEITSAAAANLLNMKAALTGGQFGSVAVETPASRAKAQELIVCASTGYADWLKGLDGSDFDESVNLGFVTMSRGQCMMIPVIDLVHHHGQIAYIQTILGDTESHFHAVRMQGITS
ncbi:hypothetical protein EON83_06610 [bacterium]|nr:MAG: hypothetical protein EON83_06610 [bacterium]